MSGVEIDDHSEEFLDNVNDALERALTAIGIHIEGEAKEELENSPRRVDTGLLRNSITYALDGEEPNITSYSGDQESKYGKKGIPTGSYSGTSPKESVGRSVTIGSNVSYARYVSEGTLNMSPNRFMKNAVERNKDQIKTYIENELRNG